MICAHCGKPVAARQLVTIDKWPDRFAEPEARGEQYEVLVCPECECPMLIMRESLEDSGFEGAPEIMLFPAQRTINPSVPEPLRREWSEASICFEARAYAACVVMVRRTIEGTCQHEGITERNLERALIKLGEAGKIDGSLVEWATELRHLGNAGAHYSGIPMDRQDAEDGLRFVEALLDHIYVLRKRFDEFKARRARPQAPTS